MVTGPTHASRCATQPICATVTDNYAQNSMPTVTLTEISWVNLKFPEFSLSFPELKNSWVFQVFQSCKHPVLSPSDRPVILVFRHQRFLRKSGGFTPNRGAKYKRVAIFDQYAAISRKR